MILNYIWIALILIAVLVGIVQCFLSGETAVLTDILNSTFSSSNTGFARERNALLPSPAKTLMWIIPSIWIYSAI